MNSKDTEHTQQLLQVLKKLVGYHRQLLDTVRLEKTVLIDADLQKIQEVTRAKETLIEGIRSLESQRVKVVVELALSWKKPLRELSVSQIIIEVQGDQPEFAEALRSTYQALKLLIERAVEQNLENRALLEKSLEHVHQMKMNVLGQSVPKTETYNPYGQRKSSASTVGGARLISKEA